MEGKLTLTRNEAARELSVSLPVLDAWLHRAENPLPHIRCSRRVIIPADGLQAWLSEEVARNQRGNAAVSGR